MPVVMISTFIIAIVVLLSSVLADLITAMLDPRIRLN
jgi:ABC-type dipeptide/oligopeptide/nickel transport system permease component